MENQDKKPANNRGQGRKSLVGGGNTPVTAIRLTPAQREKLSRLGGPEWVRKAIEQADGTDHIEAAVNQALDKVGSGIAKLIEAARAKP